jgi:putative FmdB family regulatory protein
MTYEYQCGDEKCGFVQELILQSHNDRPEWKKCPACGGRATQVILTAPSVSRQGSDNAPFDVAVGRDAAARWERIHERQAKRDKVRTETGASGLQLTGFNEYKPLPPDKKLTLVTGIEAKADTPKDAKLVKK